MHIKHQLVQSNLMSASLFKNVLFLTFNCKMESYLWEFWHTNIIYANYQHPKLCRFSKIEYIDSQPNALNISYYLCTKHTVKIHSCAIHPFFLLMYSSIWPIAMHHSIFIPKNLIKHQNHFLQEVFNTNIKPCKLVNFRGGRGALR